MEGGSRSSSYKALEPALLGRCRRSDDVRGRAEKWKVRLQEPALDSGVEGPGRGRETRLVPICRFPECCELAFFFFFFFFLVF